MKYLELLELSNSQSGKEVITSRIEDIYQWTDIISIFVIVVETEQEALNFKIDDFRIVYCKTFEDFEKMKYSFSSICMTNELFLEINEKWRPDLIDRGSAYYLFLNEALPWLETLPEEKEKFKIGPKILKSFEDVYVVYKEKDFENDVKSYCSANAFEEISSRKVW